VDFDVVVIGSGFGGAITACRLAQKKCSVLILERGREWDKDSYPRGVDADWIWSHTNPEKYHGWMDLRVFQGMSVVQGAGVGGGSLIYANISKVPPCSPFDSGWPAAIKYSELLPYYDTVGQMLDVAKVPDSQTTPRMQLMEDAAQKIREPQRFERLDLTVSFDSSLKIDFNREPDPANTSIKPNRFGALQGHCVHLGECDIGCRVYAKNTLDKNYIPVAIKNGAKLWPLHLVTGIEPINGGYRVTYDHLAYSERVEGKVTARRVIVAAGSLGSTELLLRSRDQGLLPNLSPALGKHWSSNGDFLTPALHLFQNVWADRGPTIGSAINYLDGSQNGRVFWVQDGGIPNVLGKYFEALDHLLKTHPEESIWAECLAHHSLLKDLTGFIERHEAFRHIMPWFAQGVDAGDGRLELQNGALNLIWNIAASEPLFRTIAAKHQQLARATHGIPMPLPEWEIHKDLITPHALGGCNMADSAADGVVNHKGEVFGYPGLFVADGAIVPRALGVNPSRTIGALAERIADLMPPC
jgi:cholesterol oxidase